MKNYVRHEIIEQCKLKLLRLKESHQKTLNQGNQNTLKSTDFIDQANEEIAFNQSQYFRDRMAKILPEINHALDRIDKGTFGVCEFTGAYIEENRLLAVPWTRTSLFYMNQEAS